MLYSWSVTMPIDRSMSLRSWGELDKTLWKIHGWAEKKRDRTLLKEADKAIFLLRYFFAEVFYENKKNGPVLRPRSRGTASG
jgi:hypothetical protein